MREQHSSENLEPLIEKTKTKKTKTLIVDVFGLQQG